MSVRTSANRGMHGPDDGSMGMISPAGMEGVGAPPRSFAGTNYQYARAAAPHPLTGLGRPGFAGSGEAHANRAQMHHELQALAHHSAARQMAHQNQEAHLLNVAMTTAGHATHVHQQGMVMMHEVDAAVKHVMELLLNAHDKSLTALRLLTRHKDLTRRVSDPVHMDRHHIVNDEAVVNLVYNTIVSNGQVDSHQGAITTAHVAEAAADLAAQGLTLDQVKSQAMTQVKTSHAVSASLPKMIEEIFKYAGKTHMGAGSDTAGPLGAVSVKLAICSALATINTASMKQTMGEFPSQVHQQHHTGSHHHQMM